MKAKGSGHEEEESGAQEQSELDEGDCEGVLRCSDGEADVKVVGHDADRICWDGEDRRQGGHGETRDGEKRKASRGRLIEAEGLHGGVDGPARRQQRGRPSGEGGGCSSIICFKTNIAKGHDSS